MTSSVVVRLNTLVETAGIGPCAGGEIRQLACEEACPESDGRPDALALAFIRNVEIRQSMRKRARRARVPALIGMTHAQEMLAQT